MNLVYHEIGHALVYIIVVIPLYLLIQDRKLYFKLLFLGLVVTMLMDLDHLIDYFIEYGFWLNLEAFFKGRYFTDSGKFYLLLHGWEFVLASFIGALFFRRKVLGWTLLFIGTGIGIHLLWDTWFYGFDWDFYLLSRRAFLGFDVF